ncbi:MAG: histidinol-phosphatase [Oscillospiraceae bacterium]|nr:histidinol-phosphatase [Oscillospiraceae bacterium]
MFANYHTHTWRCNHAESDERAYIEAAIAGGMKILGFSDHTPYPGLASWFRMEVGQAPEYFQTVRALRDEYAGRIEIHAGVEAEYYPAHFSELMDLLRQNGCEYMILGQHYLDSETDSLYTANASADDGRLRRYADEVEEGIETGLFTYVAHPDVFHYTGTDEALYRAQMRRICQAANRRNVPLEVNLLGLRMGRCYPARRFWEVAAEENCRAVLGCDAHYPRYLNDPKWEEEARRFLAQFGITPEETVPLVAIG